MQPRRADAKAKKTVVPTIRETASLSIPGKPTASTWLKICGCLAVAIPSIGCPFFFQFPLIISIASWTVGGIGVVVFALIVTWTTCEMNYNKNVDNLAFNLPHFPQPKIRPSHDK
ncbi:MAG: hypothetical protein LBI34_00420 [Puniceicoccales bacterium]|jgi:hypothetical protein|nr:hypothetical protein [Puniceicoccales bacterium]